MKKSLLALSAAATLVAGPAMADTSAGVYAGVQGWHTSPDGGFASNNNTADFNLESDTQTAAYVAFEHPLPFVPNLKLNYTTLETDGNTALQSDLTFNGDLYTANSNVYTNIDIDTTDIILYYELFDNDLVSFDLGINAKYIDGALEVNDVASNTRGYTEFSGIIPMAYSRVQVGLPFTGLGAYAEGSYLSFDDHKLSDYQVALTYSFIESLALDMTLQVGYRNVDMDIEDLDDVYADMTFDGAFAGLEIHF